MKIARVFPRKTSMSPIDEDVYFGLPPFGCPKYDDVHISVTFTWDNIKADYLARGWGGYGKVRIGGPGRMTIPGEFTTGLYLRKGVVITSRGCPNRCNFCLVPRVEGGIRELKIHEGNNIADNNLLACSKGHINKVFKMLRGQKAVRFSGGLEAGRITDEIVAQLRDLSIKFIFLAYDREQDKEVVQKATDKIRKHFTREQLRCYVLIGNFGDTLEKAEIRLREAWEMGTMPFAMRYRKPVGVFGDSFVFRQRAWNLLQHNWTRPAIIKEIMRGSINRNRPVTAGRK